MPRAFYPGSFDPLHLGHLDVVERAQRLFGEVIVATMVNPQKTDGWFTLEERQAMTEEALSHLPGVRVEQHPGLVVHAAARSGADFIVKGLRTSGDFEVELQMAHTNELVSGIPTVFLPTSPARGFLSSRFIREIAREGGDVSAMVPPAVGRRLKERFAR